MSLFIRVSSVLIILLSQQYSYCQIPNDYIPSLVPNTPDVSAIEKYDGVSVSKYTGIPSIDIPIHTINFQELKIPISLKYNASGFRPSNESGVVGLGWSLLAETLITRKINGYSDLENSGLSSIGYLYSDLYTQSDFTNGENNGVLEELRSARLNGIPLDLLQDIFSVNLLGVNLKFVLEKRENANSLIVNGIFLNNKNHKIKYYLEDKHIEIIDDKGYTFEFNDIDKTTLFRGSSDGDKDAAITDLQYQFGTDGNRLKQKIMSWHLTKIVSYDGEELIFNYINGAYFTYPQLSYSANFPVQSGSPSFLQSPSELRSGATLGGFESKHLSLISGNFGEINFIYDDDRKDLIEDASEGERFPGIRLNYALDGRKPKRLTNIQIKNSLGTQIKNIDFNHSYFNSNKLEDEEKEAYLRLKLDALSINNKKYNFFYDSPNNLPAKDTNSIDFWGFYNGKNGNRTHSIPSYSRVVYDNARRHDNIVYFRGADRRSDFQFSKKGMLNKIVYPTGGYVEYIYEGNNATVEVDTDPETTNYNYSYLNGLPKILPEDLEFRDVSFYQSFQVGWVPEAISSKNVIISANVQSCSYNCNVQKRAPLFAIIDAYGNRVWEGLRLNVSSSSTFPMNLEEELSLPEGNYSIVGIWNQNPSLPTVGINYANRKLRTLYRESIDPYLEYEVGGLRTKQVQMYDHNNDLITETTYSYTKEFRGQILSSGKLMDQLVFHNKRGYFDYTPEFFGQSMTVSSGSSIETNTSAQGSHIGYSIVKEEKIDFIDATNNGVIENEFYNRANDYIFRYVGTTTNVYLGGDASLNEHWKKTYGDVTYGNAYVIGIPPYDYDFKNGKLLLDVIRNSEQEIIRNTEYFYNDIIIQSIPVTYVLWQDPLGRSTSLPNFGIIDINYASLLGYASLLNTQTAVNFKDNLSISKSKIFTYDDKLNVASEQIAQSFNGENKTLQRVDFHYPYYLPSEYEGLINQNRIGMLVRKVVTKNEIETAETKYEYDKFSGIDRLAFIKTKNTQTEQYDIKLTINAYSNGNITEYIDNAGNKVGIVWSEDGNYPIIEATNISSIESLRSTVENALPSGYNSFVELLNDINQLSEDTDQKQLWAIFNNNLRNNNSSIMFKSYTYQPLVGVTSISDQNNQVTYFEYDELGNLKLKRDRNLNITEVYEYNYVNK